MRKKEFRDGREIGKFERKSSQRVIEKLYLRLVFHSDAFQYLMNHWEGKKKIIEQNRIELGLSQRVDNGEYSNQTYSYILEIVFGIHAG